jgi:hypothetical protein
LSASELAPKPRASAQTPAHGDTARWQLAIQALQALPRLSAFQPGKSLQGTGTQRLAARLMVGAGAVPEATGAAAAGSATGAAIGTGLGAGAAGGVLGLTAQPKSQTLPTMTQTHLDTTRMLLLLLEALLAGLLLIGIVWWTMFSGRKDGELPPESDTEQSDRKP